MASREKAVLIVNTVLDNLRDRRPFKYDLPRMESEAPDIYEEMIKEMSEDVDALLKKEGLT